MSDSAISKQVIQAMSRCKSPQRSIATIAPFLLLLSSITITFGNQHLHVRSSLCLSHACVSHNLPDTEKKFVAHCTIL